MDNADQCARDRNADRTMWGEAFALHIHNETSCSRADLSYYILTAIARCLGERNVNAISREEFGHQVFELPGR